MGADGDLHEIRDIASKIADNAVRIAALFQIFDHGMGAIGLEAFDGARRIATWHLSEAKRFYTELALSPKRADAVKLDEWLVSHCRLRATSAIPRREVQRFIIPVRLREGDMLDRALDVLAELDRARLVTGGRRKAIHVNPALIDGDGYESLR